MIFLQVVFQNGSPEQQTKEASSPCRAAGPASGNALVNPIPDEMKQTAGQFRDIGQVIEVEGKKLTALAFCQTRGGSCPAVLAAGRTRLPSWPDQSRRLREGRQRILRAAPAYLPDMSTGRSIVLLPDLPGQGWAAIRGQLLGVYPDASVGGIIRCVLLAVARSGRATTLLGPALFSPEMLQLFPRSVAVADVVSLFSLR